MNVSDLSVADRYLNLAMINMGEAMTELGNIRQRGALPGSDCARVKGSLERALAALSGTPYAGVPIDPQHIQPAREQSGALEGFHGGVQSVEPTAVSASVPT